MILTRIPNSDDLLMLARVKEKTGEKKRDKTCRWWRLPSKAKQATDKLPTRPSLCNVHFSFTKFGLLEKIPPLEIKDFHQQINQLSLSAENHNDNVVEILDAGRKIPKLCQSICQWLEQNQPWIP